MFSLLYSVSVVEDQMSPQYSPHSIPHNSTLELKKGWNVTHLSYEILAFTCVLWLQHSEGKVLWMHYNLWYSKRCQMRHNIYVDSTTHLIHPLVVMSNMRSSWSYINCQHIHHRTSQVLRLQSRSYWRPLSKEGGWQLRRLLSQLGAWALD